MTPDWLASAHWLRSVAYRRNGDLQRAREELAAASSITSALNASEPHSAHLVIDWLDGRVDDVRARGPKLQARYEQEGELFLAKEAMLDCASKAAWLGEPDTARALLVAADSLLPGMTSALTRILRRIAAAAVAVAEGQEAEAAELLHAEAIATLGGPESWYWRDHAAIALVHVLVPATRPLWVNEPLGPPHVPAVVLAEALEAARRGDLLPVGNLRWPEPGIVRANLPTRWVAELAAAGLAAGNPPPDDLLDALGAGCRPALHAVITTHPTPRVVAAAKRMIAALPIRPAFHLSVGVIGPLELRRDGEPVAHHDLRRVRVRELLCYLVAHPRTRREEVAAQLWPELNDGGHNLRVTLNYLQRILQPDRADGEPPYFLRADSTWLTLATDEHLDVDLWELESRLDEADDAERAGAPGTALAAYEAMLPLWRGDPFADVPYADWAQPARSRLRSRYTAASVRAGELLLAAGRRAEADSAAACAITAEPSSEPAYRLLARSRLAENDRSGARRAIDDCLAALADLNLEPESATLALLAPAAARAT